MNLSCHSCVCELCGRKNTHFWPSWIVLRGVTFYRPETETNKLKLTLANTSLLSDFCHLNVMFICLLSLKWEKWQNSDKNYKLVTLTSSARSAIECFQMTSRRPYWCPKTMKQRPCWCPKVILWELKSFLMQTLSFVPINLHRCGPREWNTLLQPRLFGHFPSC